MTHNEVFVRLGSADHDRSTIYRNLIDLSEVGLLRRIDLGDHSRFEAEQAQPDHGAHPHFVCTQCGAVECLPIMELVLPRGGTTPRVLRRGKIEIQARGHCATCAVTACR